MEARKDLALDLIPGFGLGALEDFPDGELDGGAVLWQGGVAAMCSDMVFATSQHRNVSGRASLKCLVS